MKRISTHVLDTARGVPARGVPVRLEAEETPGNWLVLGLGLTDEFGRCSQLAPEGSSLAPGIYRLAFDTASYYAAQTIEGLYPVIQITFTVRGGETHYHIPLLLSPHGYTTYRGS
jgi:5-hydroxyisourate hydrolase